MARNIYRPAALDRLTSPDTTDRPAMLVGASAWGALVIVLGLLCLGAVWAMCARAPVKIAASGIAIPVGGFLEIVSDGAGRIGALPLTVGQLVAEDDTIAVFERRDLERELAKARAGLADAEQRLVELKDFYARSDSNQTATEDVRLATVEQTKRLVTGRLALLEEKVRSLAELTRERLVLRDQLIDAELQLANARERLLVLDDEVQEIELARLERRSRFRLALIEEELGAAELVREVRLIESRLADEGIVRSAYSGLVVEVRASRGDMVEHGAALATIDPGPSGNAEDGGVVALLYVDPADGRRIETGMRAEVEPSTARRAEYGYIVGEVVAVSSVPSTAEGMGGLLHNERLVSHLSRDGPPFEVRVRLNRNPDAPSGLEWSSSSGPDKPLLAGTLLEGRIVIREVPLLDLLAPGLTRRLWGGDE